MEHKDNKDELSRLRQKRILELEKEAVVQEEIAKAIKVSETRYRRLFETAKDGILILDANTGKISDANPFLTDLLGYSRKELLGKELWEIGPFKDIAISKTAFKELQKNEYVRYDHLPLESKDGRRLDVEFVSNVYRVDHKKVIQCNIRDITERKLAEEALRKSDAFNKSIIDSSNDCLKMLDIEGRLQYMSPGGQRLLGIKDMGRYLNIPYQEFWKGTDHLSALEAIHKAQQGHTGTFQGYCPTVDGTPKWWDVAITPVLGTDGKPERLLAVSRDITERKRTEEALRESEEKYRSLFENMLDGFAYCKMLFEHNRPQDFIYLDVNSAFERLTGLKNVVGRKVTEVIPGVKEAHPELFEIYGRVALTGKPERFEIYLEPLGVWLSISVYSTKKEFFVAVFDNITERKKIAERLQHQAYHDNLTDLPNGALFIDYVNLEFTHARRNQRKLAVLFFDLDRFKNINDSMGHAVGDELLKKVAERLKACMRESDSAARIGGDEFVMLLTDIVHVGDISKVAEKIISAFSEPFTVYDKALNMTASIGISVYPDDGQNAEDLIKNADRAMYQAKEQGRNNYQFYAH